MDLMRIKLGHGLDGSKPQRIDSSIGEKEVGTMGFLSILETQCGVAAVTESSTTRIIQYMACLKELDTPDRFYHPSFLVDEFNVARTLLQWRDSWYESGWNGQLDKKVTHRLQDMADLEQLAKGNVGAGVGERLQTLLLKLKIQTTQVEQVNLLDPLGSFSPLWQQILEHFKVTQQPDLKIAAKQTSDLTRLQNSLIQLSTESLAKDKQGSVKKIQLVGDNSFVVIKAKSKAVSSRLITQWLAKNVDTLQEKTTAVLTSSAGTEIDDALEAVDLPRLGFDSPSPWRPVLQVLPITLDLLWAPLDPEILLQFLMHPVGPLVGRIRKPLANIVAQAPGIGGKEWQEKLTELLEKEQNRENFSEKNFKQLQTDIQYWFDSERYAPQIGLPIDIAKQRCSKVANWLAGQQAKHQDEAMRALYGVALNQANELKTVLTNLLDANINSIKPEQLRYLLDQVTGTGSGIVDKQAECTPNKTKWLYGTQQDASFNQAVETVIWWDLQANSSQTAYAWSRKEIEQLAANNIQLPDLDKQLQFHAKNALKPIYAATERLIVVLHEGDESHHPLWDQINSCVENWHEIQLEDSVLNDEVITALNDLTTSPVNYQALPLLCRWWQLKTGKELGKREKESYSSLENFFYSPYQWVLRYKARLSAGILQSISDGNLLKGNLVHHLYERFFNEQPEILTSSRLQTKKLEQWFDTTIEKLLLEEGAVLLMSGRLVEKQQFIVTARESLKELVHQLRKANVVKVEMETAEQALFVGGNIGGYIDMKVINAQNEEALIDIKWGGDKYRKSSLKDNKHLQLVTYSYLRHKSIKKWPPVAYFIITSGTLLAQNKVYFPEATEVTPTEIENHASIWQKMEKTWKWRRKQIDKGLIEVTVSGTEADADSIAEEDALSIPESSDRFNDYRVLTGWRK